MEKKNKNIERPPSGENYHVLFEQATDAIMVTDFRGDFKDVNTSLCNMFGYTRDELLHLNVRSLLDPAHIESKPLRFDLLAAGESVHNERKMVHKNGTIIHVEANAKKFVDDRVLVIARDITERKKAEEALQKSEANLHTIFDNTDTIYILVDHDLKIISCNPRAVDFALHELGQPFKAGEYILDHFPADRQPLLLVHMMEVFGGMPIQYEVSYPQANGSLHWYYVRMFPISKGDDTIYGLMVAVSDITEKKMLEQELLDQKVQEQKRITRAVLHAQEVQSNRMGQELHDNINQVMACVKLYLDSAEKRRDDNRDLVSKAKALVETAIHEIRMLSREQVTPQKKFDIRELIEELVRDLNDNTDAGARFHCTVTGHFSMDEDLKLNIYRIIQEQVNNILKYAAASEVTISVSEDENMVYVTVIDNGKGFDPLIKRKGIGISNIINRAESFNGQVTIESSPGNGCKLEIRIPLAAK